MANTPIRSSTQLFIDDNLDFKSKKGVNLLAGTSPGDAVEYTQLNTAIANAVSGLGNSIHVPVADLTAAKAVIAAGRSDKMLMLIETLGLYRFDAESVAVSNDMTIIRPTDIASDASAGRWIKISSTITDHDNLSNILGNGTYHLSLAERDKLTGITPGANLYVHPNHTGEATSIADGSITLVNSAVIGKVLTGYVSGAGTITATDTILSAIQKLNGNSATNANLTGPITSVGNATSIGTNVVTLANMSQVATATFLGRSTAGTGNVEALSVAQVKTSLGISSRTYRATPVGTVNGSNTAFTIAALVLSGSEEVFKNGQLMNAGAGNDYTITYGATTTITFATAPSATGFSDVILVNYSI